MSVARVSVAEFKTEDGSKKFTEDYAKQYHDIFPTAEASLSVRTGPTSSIWVTIYPNDQAVEQSFEVRTKFMKDREHFINLDESFFYEGEVMWAKLFNGNQDQPIAKEQQPQLDAMQARITELQTMLSQVL